MVAKGGHVGYADSKCSKQKKLLGSVQELVFPTRRIVPQCVSMFSTYGECTKIFPFQTWYNFALPHLSDGKFKKALTQFKDSLDVYKQLTQGTEESEFGVKVFESIGKLLPTTYVGKFFTDVCLSTGGGGFPEPQADLFPFRQTG